MVFDPKFRNRPFAQRAVDEFSPDDRIMIDAEVEGTRSMDMETFASRLTALGDLAYRLQQIVDLAAVVAELQDGGGNGYLVTLSTDGGLLGGGLLDQDRIISIADKGVTNGKLANAPSLTLKGNAGGAAASPGDLTAAQVKALLALAIADVTGLQAALSAMIPLSQKGVASGVASLDGTGKLASAQIPAGMLGDVHYQGPWNAATNTPSLAAATIGQYWLVLVAGTTHLNGTLDDDWQIGDWVICNGTGTYSKVDNTDLVKSVAGMTGVITVEALQSALGVAGEAVFLADPYGFSAANPYQAPGVDTPVSFLVDGQPVTAYVSAGASFAEAGLALNIQFQATVFRTDLGGDSFAISGTKSFDFSGASPAAISMLGLGQDQLVQTVEAIPATATTDTIGDRSQGQQIGERLTSSLATIRGNVDLLQSYRIDDVARIDGIEGQYGALNSTAVKKRNSVAVGPETLVGTFPVEEAFNDFTLTFKLAGSNRTVQIPTGTLPEDLPFLLKSPFGGNSYIGFDPQGRIIIVPGEDIDFTVTADITLDYLGLPTDTGLVKSRATRILPLEARDIAFQGQAGDLVLSDLSIYSQQAREYIEYLKFGDGSGNPGTGPLADTLADLETRISDAEDTLIEVGMDLVLAETAIQDHEVDIAALMARVTAIELVTSKVLMMGEMSIVAAPGEAGLRAAIQAASRILAFPGATVFVEIPAQPDIALANTLSLDGLNAPRVFPRGPAPTPQPAPTAITAAVAGPVLASGVPQYDVTFTLAGPHSLAVGQSVWLTARSTIGSPAQAWQDLGGFHGVQAVPTANSVTLRIPSFRSLTGVTAALLNGQANSVAFTLARSNVNFKRPTAGGACMTIDASKLLGIGNIGFVGTGVAYGGVEDCGLLVRGASTLVETSGSLGFRNLGVGLYVDDGSIIRLGGAPVTSVTDPLLASSGCSDHGVFAGPAAYLGARALTSIACGGNYNCGIYCLSSQVDLVLNFLGTFAGNRQQGISVSRQARAYSRIKALYLPIAGNQGANGGATGIFCDQLGYCDAFGIDSTIPISPAANTLSTTGSYILR